ncbi:MAG: crossover junction endodeoxyribonuclease RuvC [Pseudomonadota bacterium]
MRIMGIDPGLQVTGWGVIAVTGNHLQYVAAGSLQSNPTDDDCDRLAFLYHGLDQAIEAHMPECCAVEEVFVSKNAATSLRLGQARGVALLVPARLRIPVFEYGNRTIKKAISGSGRADKQQMYRMVNILLPGAKPDTDHSTDALATAICHAHMHKTNNTYKLAGYGA